MDPIVVSPRVVVPASAVAFHAARASGPGGQNVNKVSSKVELRVVLDEIAGLTLAERRRLDVIVKDRLDDEGRLLVTSQRTRSQPQNLDDARGKIRELVALALVAPRRRIATKPSKAQRRRRLDEKKRQGQKKRERRFSSD